MKRNRLITSVTIWLLIVSSGCVCNHRGPEQGGEAGNSTLRQPAPAEAGPYYLQAGDEVEVKFFFHPELNEQTVIRPDGRISMLLVDDVAAAGLTPSQLDETLTRLYGERLEKVDLSVIVRGYAGRNIYVDGEVKNPQALQLKGDMTLRQALIAAGGVRETADLEGVLLIRAIDREHVEVSQLNIGNQAGPQAGAVLLRPRDIIFIPKTRIARANIFVQQYLSNMMPDFIRISFPFTYSLDSQDTISRNIVIKNQ